MITYDDIFPGVADGFEPLTDDNVFKSSRTADCWNCGNQTQWVDLSFETHLCSPGCSDTKWTEYYDALRASAKMPTDDEEPFSWHE